jgi:hypothetical protein
LPEPAVGLFNRKTVCPACGDRTAYKPWFGAVECPNHKCENFDADILWQRIQAGERTLDEELAALHKWHRNPRTGKRTLKPVRRDFDPGTARIELHYCNFQGEEKTFVGDRRTLRVRGRCISLRVMPTGEYIALRRDRIHNLDEIEAALEALPTKVERQVLAYHRKYGTTSPLHQKVKSKYPDW